MSQPGPRVLIAGATGMLGGMICRYLSSRYPGSVAGTQRRDRAAERFLDAADPASDLDATIGEATVVVNAVAMLKALIDESNPASVERAVEVNARFPHRLAAAAARRGARLIHVSTDGVFSGHPALLDEGAPADASDVYGRSKRNGEVTGPAALTLRCSIVGPDPVNGRSLYEWLRSRPSGSSVRGFTDQQWNGTTTLQIAELCEQLMDAAVFDAITAVSPLRHCCPNPPVSKYELLCGLRDALGLDVTVESVASGAPSDRTLHSRWTDLNELLPEADWPQLLTALVGADPRGRVAQGVPL